MKFLKLLRLYLKGIRLSVLVLTVMMLWAMFMGVITFAQLKYIRTDVDTLQTKNADDAAVLVYFPSGSDLAGMGESEYAELLEEKLEAEPLVETVLTIRTVNSVKYEGNRINIVIYDPEFCSLFPGLKKAGMNFSSAPDGCILGSALFGKLGKGDTISLEIGGKRVEFPVAGRLQYPYRRMNLTLSGTKLMASNLFKEGDAILMQRTDSVNALIEEYAISIDCHRNVIVVFKEEATQAQREEILKRVAPLSVPQSFSDIWEYSNGIAESQIKTQMPLPLFLAVSAAMAFFSILVLTFHKKRRDTALVYLCGCSRKKCGLLVFSTFQLVALPAILFTVGYIYLWPHIQWRRLAFKLFGVGSMTRLTLFFLSMDRISVTPDCLNIVFIYYLATLIISIGVAIWSMAKYTPTAYLRGVTK